MKSRESHSGLRVGLLANYLPDRRVSMNLFSDCLAAGLTEAGLHCELIRPQPAPGFFRSWGSGFAKYIWFQPALRRALKRVDLIHVCDPANAVYLNLPQRKKSIVTCHDLHGLLPLYGKSSDFAAGRVAFLWQRLIRRGLARADLLACVSQETAHHAHDIFPGGSPKISLVFNSIYQEFPAMPTTEARRLVATALPALGERPYLLHIGSNAGRKNRAVLIDLLARFSPAENFVLVLAGSGPGPKLAEKIQAAKVEDRVLVCAQPNLTLINALYRSAHALVFPSTFEGFGLPVAEAMVCGCPIVASDIPTHREIVGSQVSLLPPHNVEGMLHLVKELRHEEARRAQIAAVQTQVARLHPRRMVGDYLDLYRDLMAN